ncbi:hypothetical protein B0I35DRAFT_430231 [Stachybotrys elegans]|uniref:Uncharacterized protein n=1 Tax=Stachybotrys elegans TaxID=80388 RepID=A0A8K0SQI1_9HYPO|nr:hypothetical protein B0I35DRAFT_430231 [Stachybotrys elegans]
MLSDQKSSLKAAVRHKRREISPNPTSDGAMAPEESRKRCRYSGTPAASSGEVPKPPTIPGGSHPTLNPEDHARIKQLKDEVQNLRDTCETLLNYIEKSEEDNNERFRRIENQGQRYYKRFITKTCDSLIGFIKSARSFALGIMDMEEDEEGMEY